MKGLESPDFLGWCAEVLHELDTAALALLHGRHVLHGEGEVERVTAPSVHAAVALETVNVVTSYGKTRVRIGTTRYL